MKYFISEAAKKVGLHPNSLITLEDRKVVQPERVGAQKTRLYSEADLKKIERYRTSRNK